MGIFSFRRNGKTASTKPLSQRREDNSHAIFFSGGLTEAIQPLSYGYQESEIYPTRLMSHEKPWRHTISLFGVSAQAAEKFALRLEEVIAWGPKSFDDSYQATMDNVLNQLCVEFWPGKEFYSPAFNNHELREKISARPWSELIKRETVAYALQTNSILEFGYTKLSPRGKRRYYETHVRRVLVKSVDENGFLAEHRGGFRRYSHDRVAWAGVDLSAKTIEQEQTILLHFRKKKSGFSSTIAFGDHTLAHARKVKF